MEQYINAELEKRLVEVSDVLKRHQIKVDGVDMPIWNYALNIAELERKERERAERERKRAEAERRAKAEAEAKAKAEAERKAAEKPKRETGAFMTLDDAIRMVEQFQAEQQKKEPSEPQIRRDRGRGGR